MAVIAKCAFGMTIENLGSDDDPFIQKGKRILNPPSGTRLLQFLVFCKYPNLAKRRTVGINFKISL